MKKLYTFLFVMLSVVEASFSQSSACSNKDFGLQNFTNWAGQSGNNTGSSNLNWTSGFQSVGNNAWFGDVSAQQSIITLNALDSFCIDPLTGLQDVYMTRLAPKGGTASVSLGNSCPGAGAEG